MGRTGAVSVLFLLLSSYNPRGPLTAKLEAHLPCTHTGQHSKTKAHGALYKLTVKWGKGQAGVGVLRLSSLKWTITPEATVCCPSPLQDSAIRSSLCLYSEPRVCVSKLLSKIVFRNYFIYVKCVCVEICHMCASARGGQC